MRLRKGMGLVNPRNLRFYDANMLGIAHLANKFHTRSRKRAVRIRPFYEPGRAEEALDDMRNVLNLLPNRHSRESACEVCGEWVRRDLAIPELPPEHPGNCEIRTCTACGHREMRAITP